MKGSSALVLVFLVAAEVAGEPRLFTFSTTTVFVRVRLRGLVVVTLSFFSSVFPIVEVISCRPLSDSGGSLVPSVEPDPWLSGAAQLNALARFSAYQSAPRLPSSLGLSPFRTTTLPIPQTPPPPPSSRGRE
jgi:hypothetical protein